MVSNSNYLICKVCQNYQTGRDVCVCVCVCGGGGGGGGEGLGKGWLPHYFLRWCVLNQW